MLTAAQSPAFRNQLFRLGKEIRAIQILSGDERGLQLSPVMKLPAGADIETQGAGYDGNTIKVLCGGQTYFVFEMDLLAAV